MPRENFSDNYNLTACQLLCMLLRKSTPPGLLPSVRPGSVREYKGQVELSVILYLAFDYFGTTHEYQAFVSWSCPPRFISRVITSLGEPRIAARRHQMPRVMHNRETIYCTVPSGSPRNTGALLGCCRFSAGSASFERCSVIETAFMPCRSSNLSNYGSATNSERPT